MKHMYFDDERALRRRMLFRLLRDFDFDAPTFRPDHRIAGLTPRNLGAAVTMNDSFYVEFMAE